MRDTPVFLAPAEWTRSQRFCFAIFGNPNTSLSGYAWSHRGHPLGLLAVIVIDAGAFVRSLPAWIRGRAPLDRHHCRESARWHAARGIPQ